jgi:hypothetical protein
MMNPALGARGARERRACGGRIVPRAARVLGDCIEQHSPSHTSRQHPMCLMCLMLHTPPVPASPHAWGPPPRGCSPAPSPSSRPTMRWPSRGHPPPPSLPSPSSARRGGGLRGGGGHRAPLALPETRHPFAHAHTERGGRRGTRGQPTASASAPAGACVWPVPSGQALKQASGMAPAASRPGCGG